MNIVHWRFSGFFGAIYLAASVKYGHYSHDSIPNHKTHEHLKEIHVIYSKIFNKNSTHTNFTTNLVSFNVWPMSVADFSSKI